MIRLVVNGDDFGMTASISQGIVRAYRDGILTSCSILGNCEAFGTHVALLQAAPGIGVGIHLALVGGRPVLPPSCIRSLVDKRGMFPQSWLSAVVQMSRMRQEEIIREFDTQILRALNHGLVLDHLDTHCHLGCLPRIRYAVGVLSKRYGLPALRCIQKPSLGQCLRRPRRAIAAAGLRALDYFAYCQIPENDVHSWGFIEFGHLDENTIVALLTSLPPGNHEIICHPGDVEKAGHRNTGWHHDMRQVEVAALTSPLVSALIIRRQISLCRWSDLRAVV